MIPSWQTVRDLILAALVAGAAAAVDYLTASIQTHPLGSAALTAAVVAALGILRRWLNPTVPVANLEYARFVTTVPIKTEITASFAPAPDLDDDQFLSACATQINAHIRFSDKAKNFDPATLIAILIQLFLANVDLESLIEKAKAWLLGWLARWKLRSAIKAAMLAAGDSAYPATDDIDGYAEWLGKADGSVLRRVRTIANSRRK